MSAFWEEGINDMCKITSENSALFLSKPCPTQETPSAVTATTSSSCTNPLSISLSVNTSVSLQIETTQNTQHQTRITVELNQNEPSRTVLSISTAHHRPTKPTVMDSLNRPHFRSPHTGPATISLRSARFYSSSSETHMSDLTSIMKAVVQEGRTVVTDGGPDWSTGSLLNAFILYYAFFLYYSPHSLCECGETVIFTSFV